MVFGTIAIAILPTLLPVDLRGLEPLTPKMPFWCATIAPQALFVVSLLTE